MSPQKFLRWAIQCVVTVGCLSTSAYADSVQWIVNSNGVLTGARHVQVNGAYYDVDFLDGSCLSLYNGCIDLVFTDQASAVAAGQALLDQVFVNGANGNFDTNPGLIAGCVGALGCLLYTPYELVFQGGVRLSQTINDDVGPDVVNLVITSPSLDFTNSPADTYARWYRVPEPVSAELLAVGIIVLVSKTVLRGDTTKGVPACLGTGVGASKA